MNEGVKSNIKATKPETESGKTYHIRVGNGDVPGIMLLPGSPERAMVISKNWEDSRELAFGVKITNTFPDENSVPW